VPAHANDCLDQAATQAAMDRCATDAAEASDAELNRVYRDIERRLGDQEAAHTRLVAAQRAWLAFRDAECAFAASGAEDGSAYPMLLGRCLDGLTQARVEGLRGYLDCTEGDLGCPVPPAE
jgi:uncharacterized protein YecT (DUF1311 family)